MKTATIGLIITLAPGILLASLPADAQQAGKVYRIGYLGSAPPTTPDMARNINAFLRGMRDLGYVEGQNLRIEWRYAEGRAERHPGFAAELVGLKVDVIVASVTPAVQAAKGATTTIPIVMITAGDPVGSGLVASLARPGGNVTGLSSVTIDLSAKQLELLKASVPKVTRVAVLWNPGHPAHPLMLKEAEGAARALAVQLQILEARDPDEFDRAFAAMTRERAGALLVLADPMFFAHRARLTQLAAKSRLPSMYLTREFVDAGGLISYGPSYLDLNRHAAIKGAKPADLPVEQPTKFEFVINLKTAKASD